MDVGPENQETKLILEGFFFGFFLFCLKKLECYKSVVEICKVNFKMEQKSKHALNAMKLYEPICVERSKKINTSTLFAKLPTLLL